MKSEHIWEHSEHQQSEPRKERTGCSMDYSFRRLDFPIDILKGDLNLVKTKQKIKLGLIQYS